VSERVIVVIQARQGSSRLPGKSLKALAGRPLIHHVVERAQCFAPGRVVLATSGTDRDDVLADTVAPLGVPVIRGSESDVLDRVWMAATLAQADTVVRVTGDCPFWAPDVAMRVLFHYYQTSARYAWNDTSHSGFPDGTDVEIFRYEALDEAHVQATAPGDREHVTPWMRQNLSGVLTVRNDEDWSHLKLSVDKPEDYEQACRIAAKLPPRDFRLETTIEAARAAGVL
jgi:spore coat polysaccharide biosynthesis protein SpsF (cytidylyltransferase family)